MGPNEEVLKWHLMHFIQRLVRLQPRGPPAAIGLPYCFQEILETDSAGWRPSWHGVCMNFETLYDLNTIGLE